MALFLSVFKKLVFNPFKNYSDKGAGSGGAGGAAAPPPALWLGGRGGAEGAPPLWKIDVINITISLNLRRMKKENEKLVILMQ